MNRICVLNTYWGKWPNWMAGFLWSCERNPDVDWLILSDIDPPDRLPPNVRIVEASLQDVLTRASEVTGVRIQKDPYGFHDLRPAFGEIFEEYFAGYDFWGHCDLDVIWGDLRSFFTDECLADADVVSSRRNELAGHFNLWRNSPEVNAAYRDAPDMHEVFSSPDFHIFDERGMSRFLRGSDHDLRVVWDQQLAVGWHELDERPRGWHWDHGELLDAEGTARPYLHFMRWKPTIKCDFELTDRPDAFLVTRRGLWAGEPPWYEQTLDRMPVHYVARRTAPFRRAFKRPDRRASVASAHTGPPDPVR